MVQNILRQKALKTLHNIDYGKFNFGLYCVCVVVVYQIKYLLTQWFHLISFWAFLSPNTT